MTIQHYTDYLKTKEINFKIKQQNLQINKFNKIKIIRIKANIMIKNIKFMYKQLNNNRFKFVILAR